MHQDVKDLMVSEATLLMEVLAKEVGYKDEELAAEMRDGFHTIGILPDCREFPHERVDPTMEVEGLRTVSKWAQRAVIGQLRKNKKLASHIMEKCMSEARPEGTLKGPFTKEEVAAILGPHWVPIPRFGLGQGQKIRMIDDARLYSQNATVGRSFKLTLGGLDQLVAIAKVWFRAVSDDRNVRIKYPDGSWREGVLHEEWLLAEARKLLGRLLHLSDAYKQLASRPEEAYAAVVAALDE